MVKGIHSALVKYANYQPSSAEEAKAVWEELVSAKAEVSNAIDTYESCISEYLNILLAIEHFSDDYFNNTFKRKMKDAIDAFEKNYTGSDTASDLLAKLDNRLDEIISLKTQWTTLASDIRERMNDLIDTKSNLEDQWDQLSYKIFIVYNMF